MPHMGPKSHFQSTAVACTWLRIVEDCRCACRPRYRALTQPEDPRAFALGEWLDREPADPVSPLLSRVVALRSVAIPIAAC